MSAERGRVAERLEDNELNGGHGYRLCGTQGAFCRKKANLARRANGEGSRAGDGEEGGAGTADAGVFSHEGLPPRLPSPPGAVAGGEPAMGKRALGCSLRQGRKGHHKGFLHNNGK